MSEEGRAPGLSRMAHDLRGPLGVTRGHARLLLDGLRGPLSEAQRRSVEAIERQTSRLDGLIDSLERLVAAHEPLDLEDLAPPRAEPPRARPRILVAEDDVDVLEVLRELLGERYDVETAEDGEQALERLAAGGFALAVVDLRLPKLDGFELARRMAELDAPPAFMFLSAASAPETKVQGLALGAADYVTKPFDPDELLARVARIVANVEREASLRADANSDPLTGLANFRSLSHGLRRELERARRYDAPLALLTVDLDDLKRINDDFGHAAGNEAIRRVASVLQSHVRSFDLVARQGGDEFAVLLPSTTTAEAHALAERLRHEIGRQEVHGRPLSVSIGVGSREKGDDEVDVRRLVERSDEALYGAKRAGKNRVV